MMKRAFHCIEAGKSWDDDYEEVWGFSHSHAAEKFARILAFQQNSLEDAVILVRKIESFEAHVYEADWAVEVTERPYCVGCGREDATVCDVCGRISCLECTTATPTRCHGREAECGICFRAIEAEAAKRDCHNCEALLCDECIADYCIACAYSELSRLQD